ncbi:LysR family transcriptional regulator [Enterobacter vonholyi]
MKEQFVIENLTGLISFSQAATQGSYTAAARILSVSPSAVSKSIQRLENRLGIRLFNRTTRALTLTPEGHIMLERVQSLITEVRKIEQLAATRQTEPSGILKIAAPLPIGTHIVGPALPEFCRLYPRLKVDMRLADRYSDIIGEGIDVAIRVGKLADSGLLSRHLGPNQLCTYASPIYLAQNTPPTHPSELSEHVTVNYRYQSSGYPLKWPFKSGLLRWEIIPDSDIVVDTSDALLTILIHGGGIGMLATYIASDAVKRGELVPLLSDFGCSNADISAVWPESRRGHPGVRAFVDYLQKIFKRDDMYMGGGPVM